MKKSDLKNPLVVLGFAFIVLGITTNFAFLAVGVLFIFSELWQKK